MSKCNCEKDNCLPPQVLQINNQECPTLFHRVTIPAEIGDDETYPPKPGLYRNTLLVYEVNGHAYMFSSDGIPTRITGEGGSGTTDYNALINKPSIDGHELMGDSTLYDIGAIDAITTALVDYTKTDDLATVALSGDYNDLLNKPTTPVTHFYLVPAYTAGSPSLVYNDSAHTSQTTYQEFQNAILSGPVQVHQEYDVDTYWISNIALTDIWLNEYISFYVDAEQWRGLYRWGSTDAAPLFQGSQDYYSQVQADWNVTNTSSSAYIKNKPAVNNATLTVTQNGTSAGTFTANASSDTTISLTDTTYSDFSGATSLVAGAHGLVPAPAVGDEGKVLHGDGTWKDATAKLVEMSYGESNAWAKFIAAYNAGSIVYCRASSNSDPGTGTQGRKAFMAYVNNAENPTEVEFQYVRSVSSKTSSQPVDQVFVYKLTNANGGTWTVQSRNMAPKLAAGTNTTVNYSNGTYTISATVPTPTVFNMTYDTTATTWTDTDIGITLQETPYGTFPAILEQIQTFAVPTPVFTNASTGSTLDAEGLYNLLETGADVVLNGVPVGVRLRRVNGTTTFTVGSTVCDGVRLTKVGPFHIEDFDPDTSELVYSMDLSSYSATVSANAVGTTMPTLLPFAIRVYKMVTFDSEVSPDPQTEYAFEIQGTSHNHMDAPT